VVGGGFQSVEDSVLEQSDQLVFDLLIDRVVAGVAGQVGLVDQAPERVGDLGGPGGVGVDLARAVDITK
jgi:hypothetical protein